mmetsp:Transcript_31138/g.85301  ORF Transcript_31138/g.85301 Transcript_31138/m.85301 type:complete len:229 (-) Transcript_31138:225-911(-)
MRRSCRHWTACCSNALGSAQSVGANPKGFQLPQTHTALGARRCSWSRRLQRYLTPPRGGAGGMRRTSASSSTQGVTPAHRHSQPAATRVGFCSRPTFRSRTSTRQEKCLCGSIGASSSSLLFAVCQRGGLAVPKQTVLTRPARPKTLVRPHHVTARRCHPKCSLMCAALCGRRVSPPMKEELEAARLSSISGGALRSQRGRCVGGAWPSEVGIHSPTVLSDGCRPPGR